jgi:hypothetical protein
MHSNETDRLLSFLCESLADFKFNSQEKLNQTALKGLARKRQRAVRSVAKGPATRVTAGAKLGWTIGIIRLASGVRGICPGRNFSH